MHDIRKPTSQNEEILSEATNFSVEENPFREISMGKLKISEVKSVISEIEETRSRNAGLLMPTRFGPSAKAAQEYAELLTSFLAKAGLDVDKFNKIQDEKPRFRAKPDSELTREFLGRKNSILQNAKRLSAIPPPTTNYQLLNIQPIFIWTNPAAALMNSNIAVDDNWAKVYFDTTANVPPEQFNGANVNFLYLWENSSDVPAVVDVDTYLGLFGTSSAHSNGGRFPGNRFCITIINATMNLYLPWEKPPLPTVWEVYPVQALRLDVETGGFFSSGRSISQQILNFPHLIFNKLVVPAGDTIVFQVMAQLLVAQNEGEATFDFNQGGFNISSNFLTLQIYYPVVGIR